MPIVKATLDRSSWELGIPQQMRPLPPASSVDCSWPQGTVGIIKKEGPKSLFKAVLSSEQDRQKLLRLASNNDVLSVRKVRVLDRNHVVTCSEVVLDHNAVTADDVLLSNLLSHRNLA